MVSVLSRLARKFLVSKLPSQPFIDQANTKTIVVSISNLARPQQATVTPSIVTVSKIAAAPTTQTVKVTTLNLAKDLRETIMTGLRRSMVVTTGAGKGSRGTISRAAEMTTGTREVAIKDRIIRGTITSIRTDNITSSSLSIHVRIILPKHTKAGIKEATKKTISSTSSVLLSQQIIPTTTSDSIPKVRNNLSQNKRLSSKDKVISSRNLNRTLY